MNSQELRKLVSGAKCAICGTAVVGGNKLPIFWRVNIERIGIDMSKVRRVDGLAAVVGSLAIAEVMTPEDNLTQTLEGQATVLLCDECGCGGTRSVMELLPEAGG